VTSRIAEKLAVIRRRRWTTVKLLVGTFVAFLVSAVASMWLGLQSELLVGIVTFGGFGATMIAAASWVTSRCPRCGKLFFIRGSFGNPYAGKCLNCSLSLSSPPPGHCQDCGYDLTGNVSGVCSECGARIDHP
jgi:hypothetical protein